MKITTQNKISVDGRMSEEFIAKKKLRSTVHSPLSHNPVSNFEGKWDKNWVLHTWMNESRETPVPDDLCRW